MNLLYNQDLKNQKPQNFTHHLQITTEVDNEYRYLFFDHQAPKNEKKNKELINKFFKSFKKSQYIKPYNNISFNRHI